MYSVIAFFVMAVLVPAKKAVAACTAYLALCDVLDMLVAITLDIIQPKILLDMIDAFLEVALAAGWREWMGPKWHWMVHYSEHLQR